MRKYKFGPFTLIPDERLLLRGGDALHLSAKDFDVLCVLVENRGTLVRPHKLIAEVWPATHGQEKNIARHISNVRTCLGDDAQNPVYIETVPPRQGYRFIAFVVIEEQDSAPELITDDPHQASALSSPGQSRKLIGNRGADWSFPRSSGWPIPHRVPDLPLQGVIGRETELAKIKLLLRCAEDSGGPPQPPVALKGIPGVGKTTLAVAFGNQPEIDSLFPDGMLWAELGPKPVIRTKLVSWGDALDVDLRAKETEQACSEGLRDALYSRQVLLIVDDVWDVKHGRYFLVGGPRCATLITTREPPIARDLTTRARILTVGILDLEHSITLIRDLAPEAASIDAASIAKLCEVLGGLPLALKLAGRLLANEADVPSRMQRLLGELIEQSDARLGLSQAEGRVGIAEDEPVSLQAILGMSVSRLANPDLERFAILGKLADDSLDWEIGVAAAVWDCSRLEAEDTIAHLISRGLVERRGQRYWMHKVLIDYARKLLREWKL